MKIHNFLPAVLLSMAACSLFSQSNIQQSVSVNSTGTAAHASAQLDVSATDKGMLVPRMTSAQRSGIASPATGLLVFDTDTGGFWFYNGTSWTNLSAPKTLADADNDTKVQVEESPDEDIVRFDLNGVENMVLRKNASGYPRLEFPNALDNTFIGLDAGSANTTGGVNTALGMQALFSNTVGSSNTATGWWSLYSNTSGIQNTASGTTALYFNSTGQWNTGIGREALFNNSTGNGNTALGRRALKLNTLGSNNTALGHDADVLSNNLTNATAIGYNAKVGASNSLVLGGTGADAVNVGIGLTMPSRPLQVYSDTYGISHTFGGVELSTYIGDNAGWFGTATDHPLYFFTNDAPGPHMMIDNLGKVGIGTASPNASALLDLTATDKGILVPRMTTAQRTAIASPATGLLVYDTDTNAFWFYNGTTWTTIGGGVSTLIADADNDTKVQVEKNPDEDIIRFDLGGSENMVLRKNAGGFTRLELPSANSSIFIGLGAGQANTTGSFNTVTGYRAFFSNTTGFSNTVSGFEALFDNIDGIDNTAIGVKAMNENTNGDANTAIGLHSLYNNTTGNNNVAVGWRALFSHNGSNNTALGYEASVTMDDLTNATAIGYNAKVGASNSLVLGGTGADAVNVGIGTTTPAATLHVNGSIIAKGITDADNDTKIHLEKNADEDIIRFDLAGTEFMALRKNALGHPRLELYNTLNSYNNTFIGDGAGNANTSGIDNTAVGYSAFSNTTTGSNGTAIGSHALASNTTGIYNAALGALALRFNVTGSNNAAFGASALENSTGHSNAALGAFALSANTTGNDNVAIGGNSLLINTTGSANTALGKAAEVTTSNLTNTIVIGAGATVNASNKVRIGNGNISVIEGQVDWTFPSDARFKFNVDDATVPGLAFIEKLRPVTYQFDTRKFDEHLMQNMPDSIQQSRLLSGLAGQDYSKSSATVQTGFLAQEVEQVCKDLNFTFSGLHVPESEVDNYGLAYGSFVPLLVKGMQEQQTIIEAQKEEIDLLKSQLDKITAALQGAGIAVEK